MVGLGVGNVDGLVFGRGVGVLVGGDVVLGPAFGTENGTFIGPTFGKEVGALVGTLVSSAMGAGVGVLMGNFVGLALFATGVVFKFGFWDILGLSDGAAVTMIPG